MKDYSKFIRPSDYTDEQRGIDYDLSACLECNPQDGFDRHDIAIVLAVVEGENDETDWHWVFMLNDGRYIYLQGGCDYTGWDCQSNADHIVLESPEQVEDKVGDMQTMGRRHDYKPVKADLMEQLRTGKHRVWSEKGLS